MVECDLKVNNRKPEGRNTATPSAHPEVGYDVSKTQLFASAVFYVLCGMKARISIAGVYCG